MESKKYIVRGTLKGHKWVDSETEYMNSAELVDDVDEIKELFTQDSDDELAQYIGERETIYGLFDSIYVNVEIIGGKLYSRTEILSKRELTEEDKVSLLSYLTGQFSDGYGEGLEQHAYSKFRETIESEEWDEEEQESFTEENEIDVESFLHLWQRGDEFKLEFISPELEGVTPTEVTKPRCKLIGEDGNIFNLISIARRKLVKAGQADIAKEMEAKVKSSKSYSEALGIICDYVEVY